MTTKANILELNGRPYDAITGRLVSDHPDHRAVKAIDGFIKSPHHSEPSHSHTTKPEPSTYKTSISHPSEHTQTKAFDIHRHVPQPTHHHQPQRATTLMRHVVHRPAASLKRHTKVVGPTDILSKIPHFDIVPKHSISIIDQARLKRAERIAKSKLVSRFGNFVSQSHAPAAIQSKAPEPAKAELLFQPALHRQPSDDIFERALAHANSHTQPAVKPHHKRVSHKNRLRRFTSIAAVSLAVLIIGAFVAYQNVSQIQLNIASNKAGIHAVLPKWQPSGFEVAAVHSSPGTVAINFHGSSNKAFSLVQTATKWNDTSLFDNFVFPDSNSYETVQAAGTTIYTYNDNNATWVNNGIWYKLISNGALSSSQLVNIAVSM